jgi:DNA-binding NarL/FixJ family response regulator
MGAPPLSCFQYGTKCAQAIEQLLAVGAGDIRTVTRREDAMATWPRDHSRAESLPPSDCSQFRPQHGAESDGKVRLLLVDDHLAFRELLALRLAEEPDFTVVAEASSLAEVRQILSGVEVDLALVDLELPDGSGVDLIRGLRTRNPEAQVLVVTASDNRHAHAAAFAAGASGVLRKTVGAEEIIAAIRRLCAGDALLSPREAIEMLRLVEQQREAERTTHRLREQLTPREQQLLQLLAEGLDDAAMAERLSISPRTVRNHMAHLLDKLGVHSRLQALVLAARHGLVSIQ